MFLDTSGLMCLFDRRDNRHSSAVECYDQADTRLTHNYVLAEFVALALSRHVPMLQTVQFVRRINNSSEIEVVWVDLELHEQGLGLLTLRPDKVWSLCDAVSFVIMNQRKMTDALTTDHDFEQAGFVRLLTQ